MPDSIKMIVTPRQDSPRPHLLTTQGSNEPNVVVVEMHWAKQAAVRAVRSGIQSFLAVATTIQTINIMDGTAMQPIKLALIGAAVAALISFLQNAVELTAKWDTSRPGIRA